MGYTNSGQLPQPAGAAVVRTPQGVSDVAVAGDLTQMQAEAEVAALAATPNKRRRKKVVTVEPVIETEEHLIVVSEQITSLHIEEKP